MLRFTLLALTREGSPEGSSPPSFALLAPFTLRNEGRHEGSFQGSAPPSLTLRSERTLTPRSPGSATFRPSVPVPLCFQLSNCNSEIANPLFCAFSRHSPPPNKATPY